LNLVSTPQYITARHRCAEVFDLGVEDLVAAHLFDEHGFGLNLLPHDGVVAGLGDVVEDVDLVVLVALSQDAAFALLKIGWAPGHVDVMQRHQARLHVGTFCRGSA